MPKIEEFYPSRASLREPQSLSTGSNDHIYNKRWSATRRKRLPCTSGTITLGILGTSNYSEIGQELIGEPAQGFEYQRNPHRKHSG